MMRKNLSKRITALVLGSAMLLSIPAFAYAADVNGTDAGTVRTVATEDYELTIEDNVVTGYTGTPVNVVVPEGVTSIQSFAFDDCYSLESIEMSDSVTEIDDYAFYHCKNLANMKLSSNLTTIGGYAFIECTSLTSVEIPNSVTKIAYGAFDGCSNLKNIDIPDSVTEIGRDVFSGTLWLENQRASADNGLVVVNNMLIDGQTASGDIVIPEDVTCIVGGAFAYNDSLTSVEILSGATSIGGAAFMGCDKLKSVTIPDTVTTIEGYAFYECYSLETINIPSSVSAIDWGTFFNCSSLTSITLPSSITSIASLEKDAKGWEASFEGINENAVFYVVENSYAHEFAVNEGFTVKFITEEIDDGNKEEQDKEENTTSLTAKDTTITVTAPSSVLAGDSVFTAKEITNDKLTADIAKLLESKSIAYKNIAEYEFTLRDKNGVEIHEFSDYITISFDLPKQMSGSSKLQVYRLESDGKTLTACETTVSGTRVSFKTNHLSTYALVELANAESITQTGDNALLFIILLAGGLAFIAFGIKRRNFVR